MQDLGKILSLLATLFLVLILIFNLMPKLPRIPGDVYIDKAGIKIYIPWLSALILSVIITLFLSAFA